MGYHSNIEYGISFIYRVWDIIQILSMGYHSYTEYGISFKYRVWDIIQKQSMGYHLYTGYENIDVWSVTE